MSTFLLLHGAASSGWYWHLVEPLLEQAGHKTVAPDLPADDLDAGLAEYVASGLEAVDGHPVEEVVVVAQSMARLVRTGRRRSTPSRRSRPG